VCTCKKLLNKHCASKDFIIKVTNLKYSLVVAILFILLISLCQPALADTEYSFDELIADFPKSSEVSSLIVFGYNETHGILRQLDAWQEYYSSGRYYIKFKLPDDGSKWAVTASIARGGDGNGGAYFETYKRQKIVNTPGTFTGVSIKQALDAANSAKAEATAAKNSASTAASNATTAATNATNAYNAANLAKTSANTAVSELQNTTYGLSKIKTDTSTAATQATTAATNSSTAASRVWDATEGKSAAIIAKEARDNASSAITAANSAKTSADSAAANASSAATQAATATTQATTAATQAATAATNSGAAVSELQNTTYGLSKIKSDTGTAATQATTAATNTSYNGNSSAYWAYLAYNKTGEDHTAPVITKVEGLNGATCTTGSTFSMVVTASDNGPVSNLRYKVGSGSWGSSNTVTATSLNAGANTVTIYVSDNPTTPDSGNISQTSFTFFKL